MSALAHLGRTLADSADRETWLAVHDTVIGASTAANFARPGSAETYARQMLTPRTFRGNTTTRNGHREEQFLLAWAGAEPNSLFIHATDNTRFAATPDGAIDSRRGVVLAEAKAKHNRNVSGPIPREVRQMAWQLMCIPEAVAATFIWGEYVQDVDGGWVLRRDPFTLTFDRDHPIMIAATELIVPIARQVIQILDAARAVAQKAPF